MRPAFLNLLLLTHKNWNQRLKELSCLKKREKKKQWINMKNQWNSWKSRCIQLNELKKLQIWDKTCIVEILTGLIHRITSRNTQTIAGLMKNNILALIEIHYLKRYMMHSKAVLSVTQGMLVRCKDTSYLTIHKDWKFIKKNFKDRQIDQGDTSWINQSTRIIMPV